MSMNGEFREITPRLLERLKAEPSLAGPVVLADLLAAQAGSGLDFLLGALPAGERKAMESYLAQATPEERERMETAGQEAMKGLSELQASLAAEAAEAFERLTPEEKALLADRAPAAPQTSERAAAGRQTPHSEAGRVPPAELGERIGIGKAWHGLHYLLCGSAEPVEGDLAAAVLGGVEIGEDGGYGPARYLEPDRVRGVAAELERLPEDALRSRYDAAAMEAASIYPGHWADEDNLAWLLAAWREVASFYSRVASRGNAVLLYLV